DMLGTYNSFGVIVDEKTATSLGASWAKAFAMRGQFMGYVFAAQQYGYDVSTALIRGIGILKTQYNHVQVIESYAQWQLDRWWVEVHEKLSRMVSMFGMMQEHAKSPTHAHRFWPYSYGDGCSSYSGCTFLHLCTVEDPPQWYGDYAKRVWNPLAKDPTAESPVPKTEKGYTMEELMEGME
ncbi:hypothetical protein LCGC14_2411830, partial [marine sediment metagenome]